MVLLALVVERVRIGVQRNWHGSLRKRCSCRDRSWGRRLVFYAEDYTFPILVGNVPGKRPPAVARTAKANFVLGVVDEARDRAARADSPTREDIQESHSIEIQRIHVLPVGAGIIGNIFTVGSDGQPPPIIDGSHSRSVAARLLRGESPSFPAIQ